MPKLINIGNGAFVNANKISAIISSDADKVRKVMLKHGCDRTSAEVYDVLHRLGRKPQISAVGIIHYQQTAAFVTKVGKPRNVCHLAQIIGRGNIHRQGRVPVDGALPLRKRKGEGK